MMQNQLRVEALIQILTYNKYILKSSSLHIDLIKLKLILKLILFQHPHCK